MLLEKESHRTINTRQDGWTALHTASNKVISKLFKLLLEDNQGAGIAMLEEKQNDGWTALHMAARNDHVEIVEYLINVPCQCYGN